VLISKKVSGHVFVKMFYLGGLLLFTDGIGRQVVQPNGIPAGIMVALIGAPYFVYLLVKK
jgi:ABC-type Fe3+-siderophore transport system permease subunit